MLKTHERTMFPKLNMTGDTKAMRNGIIASKPLLRYTITKETIETSTRQELCSFMRRKRDKASITKNPKREVVRSLTIENSSNGDLLCVVGEGIRLMVYTAMSAASPQKRSRREAEMRRVQTTSRM